MALLFRTELGGGSSIEPYTVIVSLDENFKGQPVTLTQGTEIMRKTCPMTAPYEVEFKPMNDGVWVVSSTTKDGKVVSVDTEPLLEWRTYNVTLESGFNFREWLNRGRVKKTFTSLDDVLADQPTVRQLMTVHDSVDYLVTALSNDANTAEKILNNDICAKWINLRDYALDMLYANANVKAVMDSVDKYGYGEWALIDGTWQPKGAVPVMTSNTAPYGEVTVTSAKSGYEGYNAFDKDDSSFWITNDSQYSGEIGYTFTNPIKVSRVYIKNANSRANRYEVVYRDFLSESWKSTGVTKEIDGLSALTFNINVNSYHMIYGVKVTPTEANSRVGVTELQFYGRQLNVSVPTMTSDTAPWGEVSASSYIGSGYEPYKAFDGQKTTGWCPQTSDTIGNSYVAYDFKNEIVPKYAMFRRYHSSNTSAYSVKIQGYTDKWEDISNTISSTQTSTLTWTAIPITSNKVCTKVRLVIMSGSVASGNVNAQFYGVDYSEREFEEVSTMKYIYDHGVELEAVTKTNTSVLVTIDTTSYDLLRATVGTRATATDKLVCGSGNVTIPSTMMPNNCYLDISSINGSNQTGFSVVADTSDISCWLE